MQMHLEQRNPFAVQSYSKQHIQIDDQQYTDSLCVSAAGILSHFPLRASEDLTLASIQCLLNGQAKIVIMGTSCVQTFPSESIIAAFWTRGIGFEYMELGAACRTYNILLSEGRSVLAAFLF